MYSPTLMRFIQADPTGAEYVDGPTLYPLERGNPVNRLDPTGLQATVPATLPATRPALAKSGKGTWGTGDSAFDYQWDMKELSSYDKKTRDAMLTGDAPGVTIVIAVTKKPKCPYDKLYWIQYTEARQDGKIYTPAPTTSDPHPNPWGGIDRYPNRTSRTDGDPWFFVPGEQTKVNGGSAFDGRLTGYGKGDVVFVDWASSGGAANWGQYSVVSLIGEKSGKKYVIGSLQWEYTTDKTGKMGDYGARPAGTDDMATWNKSLSGGYPTIKIES